MDSRTVNLRGIAGSAGNIMQGIGGFVFGNESSPSKEDSYVERYLDRISNGVRAEDRRAAMTELQSLVSESRSAQMAFGAMGFPVLIHVLKEDREDVELVRGALETLVSALTPIERSHGAKTEVQPASMNSDLLSREMENISLLLNLLSEDDFYVRYYTIQLLTALITHSPKRLQEAILLIPRGITLLMDMLMDREVIRNETLLLLTYLTRKAEEIQKILVFEGAFDKIFSIIKEEGGSDGGVVVQDCLELLNNLICSNPANQVLMRETIGFDPIVSILKLRRGSAYNFTHQKTVNLLNALQTVELLLMGGGPGEPAKDNNKLLNQTVLAQKNVMEHLLLLGVESQWAPIAVRCLALRCIGNLVLRNQQNLASLASKQVGDEPNLEPALNAVFRTLARASTVQEFLSADYLFKCFCENNPDGQTLLASTLVHSDQLTNVNLDTAWDKSFGSMLLQVLQSACISGDLEAICRAALVLSHILKDNMQLKEQILKIELEVPSGLAPSEPLLHILVKHLSAATSSRKNGNGESIQMDDSDVQIILLYLLVIWLDCPAAVTCLLDSSARLNFLIELVSSQHESPCTRGLASFALGACVLYNNSAEKGHDAFAVVDAVSQKIGLNTFFRNFEEMQKSFTYLSSAVQQNRKPLTRSSTASMSDFEDSGTSEANKEDYHPVLVEIFDAQFVVCLSKLESEVRERIMDIYSQTKSKVTVLSGELEQQAGETSEDYVQRLKVLIQKQGNEMQELLARNATLAEELMKTGGSSTGDASRPSTARERVQSESLRKELEELSRRVELLKAEKKNSEAEAGNYKNIAVKLESDLKSLSDAYNSLEQANYHLDAEVRALREGGSTPAIDMEAIKALAKEEAEKESEAELNDLLVCLGQEQSKVEKLSARLAELGEDVDALLQGIGDEAGLPEDDADE